MFDFLGDEKFCDITLISNDGDIKIKAHRNFLAASSEYFLTMFTGSLKEAEAAEVKLSEVDGQTLKMVINFMYTNLIELQTDTVELILKAAHLFQLNALEVTCCDFMKNQLEPSNCLGIAYGIAEKYGCTALYEDSFSFALKHFMQVRDCEEFLLMDIDQLERLLSSDDLRIPSEEEVFHGVMSWIKHDQVNREKHILKLGQCVRLELIQPRLIEDTIEGAFKSSEWRELILSAYKWQSLHAFQNLFFPDELSKLRSFEDVVIAVSGWNSTNGVLNVGYYYSGSDNWVYTVWPNMPQQRTGCASAVVDEKLIIAGGKLPSGFPTNRVDCLDLRTLKWTTLSPMIVPRSWCKMAALNGKLYVFGGNSNAQMCFAEKLDSLQDSEWEEVPGVNLSKNFSVGVRGMFTVFINEIPYFIKVYQDKIIKLNLKDNTITESQLSLDFATNCATFANQLIIYGRNEFKIYRESGLVSMPDLKNGVGDIILISN